MQLHELTKEYKNKKARRIGRGGKRGTYSGKGQKGQKSRAGHKIRPAIRDLIIKLPKNRGFKFKTIKVQPVAVNLDAVVKFFKAGEIVSPNSLLEKGLIRKYKGNLPKVKILGSGEIAKKLVFQNCSFSKEAQRKIAKK
ncbi:MAG: uL15 family ribosomal protein [bacterium]|nr:uL15 family ribosomal protein [bacterium]